MCTKIFTRMMAMEERFGSIQGIKLGKVTSVVTNLLYANDILVASKASILCIASIMGILNKCGEWSSLKVNLENSNVYFSPRIKCHLKVHVK